MSKSKTNKNNNPRTKLTFSPGMIKHLSKMKFTSLSDLSDYYSKIGKKNTITDISNFNVNLYDPNTIVTNDKKIIKEFDSKTDMLYGIIFKDALNPDSYIKITHHTKKSGKSKMTIDQLYALMSANFTNVNKNINSIKKNMVTKKEFHKEIKRLDGRIDKLETKVDTVDAKVDKLKKDNNLK